MTVGTTTVKYANFLFQSPDWGLNSGFAGTGKFACCSPGYTCISLNVPPASQQGDCFDHRNDDGQICKFPLSIPGLGIEFRFAEPGNSRVDPLDTLAFHSMFPLRKAGGICIYRRNIGDKRSNFPLQPPEWRLHSGFAGTGKIRRLLSWIHLQPPDWGFAPCPRAPSTAEVLLKGEYCITRCKFSGTSKWNPGHARPHLTRGSPSPLMTILALRVLSKSAYTHMRCKKRAGGKKEGRGEKILKKNP